MKLTIATACFNQLEDTKAFWGCLIGTIYDKENTELLVVNNGSTDGTKEFIERFIFPQFPDHRMIDNPENIGVLASMQQMYKESKGDVIAMIHNDLFVFEPGWDIRVKSEFEKDEALGLAGFLGAEGIGETGGRYNTQSNMLEAEFHGIRNVQTLDCMVFDGLALIARRKMLDQIGGFDQNYTFHHFYDRDLSMASWNAGWKNKIIGIFCHHKSGITANRPDYQTWIDKKMGTANFTGDKASYDASERYFLQKWGKFLPRWRP